MGYRILKLSASPSLLMWKRSVSIYLDEFYWQSVKKHSKRKKPVGSIGETAFSRPGGCRLGGVQNGGCAEWVGCRPGGRAPRVAPRQRLSARWYHTAAGIPLPPQPSAARATQKILGREEGCSRWWTASSCLGVGRRCPKGLSGASLRSSIMACF